MATPQQSPSTETPPFTSTQLQILAVESVATLALFGTPERKAVEKLFSDKNGKPVIRCQVRNKDVPAKPEEIVRQLWIHRLLHFYKYPLARLAVEYPVTFGRDSSKRADIVIFDADRVTIPYVIIEVKESKQKDGKEQLKSYCHATGAPLAVWSNGRDKTFWHRKNPNYFVEIPTLPTASQDIADVADQPWTIETLVEKEKERETSSEARSLKDRILEMENEVLANAGVDVFEEVFKLVFTKLYDELSCYRQEHTHIRFRNTNTASQLKVRIQELFDEARARWEGVFAPDEKIKLTADHLAVCVGSVEEYKLFNSNLDVVDEAFEYLVNKSSKGEKGQYFTPRHVIDLCVRMLNPGETETLIDTACGSAGFTMHAIFHVWERILREEGFNASHLFTLQKKPRRCEKYVQDKVFAIDFDERSVRVARCLNLIAGDGQTNVLHLNTLDYRRWEDLTGDEKDKMPGDHTWRETYGPGWKKLRALRAAKGDNRAFNFDVLLANPPFAGDIKQTDMLSPYELAHKVAKDGGQGKLESAVGRDLLFIERNLDFLKPGGRMAVILPQGRFNNSSDERVRRWITERCRLLAVVGLHGNTFKPHTGTKTSVLFVQKWNDDPKAGPLCPKVDDYPIFFATQRQPSKDNSGDKILVKGADGLPVRDAHGHTLVQHDFFSVELKDGARTPEGIAEAFEEFAKKEKLPFFSLSPFGGARYKALLEGLDITELRLTEVLEENPISRLDSTFFSASALRAEAKIKRGKWARVKECAAEVASFGAYDLTNYFSYQESGIPFLRGVNIKNGFTDFSDSLFIDEEAHNLLAKSQIRPGTVLLTMSGSVGNATVALETWKYPINSNQDIAKITPAAGVSPYFMAAFLGSEFAKIQMERLPVGSVQQHIFLWMIESIVLARFSEKLETAIGAVVRKSFDLETSCVPCLAAAEQSLLHALGLDTWQPSEPLTYVRRASEVAASGRFDSVYFSPAKTDSAAILSLNDAKPLSVYFEPIREMVAPEDVVGSKRILNFDVGAAAQPVIDDASPSVEDFESAKKRFLPGDVVISRLRHYLRQIAVVRTDAHAVALGSSEFIVLRPRSNVLSQEALVVFLRCLPVQTILKYSQDGSHHPRFSEDDLLAIPVPDALLKLAPKLTAAVRDAHTARREAQTLLARAQRAVEVAIEQGERAAMALLSQGR